MMGVLRKYLPGEAASGVTYDGQKISDLEKSMLDTDTFADPWKQLAETDERAKAAAAAQAEEERLRKKAEDALRKSPQLPSDAEQVKRFVKKKAKEAVKHAPNLQALHAWDLVVEETLCDDPAWASPATYTSKGGRRAFADADAPLVFSSCVVARPIGALVTVLDEPPHVSLHASRDTVQRRVVYRYDQRTALVHEKGGVLAPFQAPHDRSVLIAWRAAPPALGCAAGAWLRLRFSVTSALVPGDDDAPALPRRPGRVAPRAPDGRVDEGDDVERRGAPGGRAGLARRRERDRRGDARRGLRAAPREAPPPRRGRAQPAGGGARRVGRRGARGHGRRDEGDGRRPRLRLLARRATFCFRAVYDRSDGSPRSPDSSGRRRTCLMNRVRFPGPRGFRFHTGGRRVRSTGRKGDGGAARVGGLLLIEERLRPPARGARWRREAATVTAARDRRETARPVPRGRLRRRRGLFRLARRARLTTRPRSRSAVALGRPTRGARVRREALLARQAVRLVQRRLRDDDQERVVREGGL